MPTSRERQLARARARRAAERRAVATRRRRTVITVVSGVVALALAGTIIGLAVTSGSGSSGTKAAAATGKDGTAASPVACGAKVPPKPVKQAYTKEPPMTIDPAASYTMKIMTSCGEIDVQLDAAKAPHTVNSFAFLASKHYFDGIHFSRSTSKAAGFAILQGGDQSSDGTGGPGYTIPDENLKGAVYRRGMVAMANAGPNTGSSQFFLLDSDAPGLGPSYTPFGEITRGLNVLDKLIAIGNDGSHGKGDGKPLKAIYINTLTVTKG